MNIRAANSNRSATMALVLGDVLSKTADLSDVPLGTWEAEAKSGTSLPLKDWTTDLGIPGYGPVNLLTAVYREADGELVFGKALIDWNSGYLRVDLHASQANCGLNFVQQLVYLYVLGIEERLQDELGQVYVASRNRATVGVSDFHQQSLVGIDVGFLIAANVFCQKVLGTAALVEAVAACGSRVATLMVAKDI